MDTAKVLDVMAERRKTDSLPTWSGRRHKVTATLTAENAEHVTINDIAAETGNIFIPRTTTDSVEMHNPEF